MENTWLMETYFNWLRHDCFSIATERRHYEGVLRVLHDIPFYWTIWSDENRTGDALSFRQSDFLGFQTEVDSLDQHWLANWAMATPSVLEVMVGIARRWTWYFEGPIQLYFQHEFKNMKFDRFPGRSISSDGQEKIRLMADDWMSRRFSPDGAGSPFPVTSSSIDMRTVDIWGQMNAYSLEHFQ